MSKPKAPSLPATPTFQSNPVVDQSTQALFGLGQGLTSGSIYDQNPMLADTVNMNPQMTQLMLQGLQAQLAGPLQQQRQDTINQLEANNQLTGSTTASALGQIDQNYTNQLVAAGAQAGISDINRALQNRVSLFGTGLNTIQAAGSQGLSSQSQMNQFNLENYQNQVSKTLAEQKQNQGGFAGALTGGLGGALSGSIFGPVGSVVGGLAGAAGGYFSPSGTGGSLLNAGAMVSGYGGGLGGYSTPTKQAPWTPGSSASNNPFQLQGSLGNSGGYWNNMGLGY